MTEDQFLKELLRLWDQVYLSSNITLLRRTMIFLEKELKAVGRNLGTQFALEPSDSHFSGTHQICPWLAYDASTELETGISETDLRSATELIVSEGWKIIGTRQESGRMAYYMTKADQVMPRKIVHLLLKVVLAPYVRLQPRKIDIHVGLGEKTKSIEFFDKTIPKYFEAENYVDFIPFRTIFADRRYMEDAFVETYLRVDYEPRYTVFQELYRSTNQYVKQLDIQEAFYGHIGNIKGRALKALKQVIDRYKVIS